jgi:uncharacterized protein YgbK (DUF1537 family)
MPAGRHRDIDGRRGSRPSGRPTAQVRVSELRPGRVVVLDDDPTGTQGVAGLPVVLNPDDDTLRRAARQWPGPLWVLTNTRAMPEEAAAALLTRIAARVRAAAGPAAQLVLRGDSTLRGHVLAEIDALSAPGSVALFVPAFVEQGRITVQGVHFVTVGGSRVPVAETEYARDPEFGYRTSDLVEWVTDRDPHRPAAGMPLDVLRDAGSSALADLLVAAPDRCVVVPDAETVADLEIIRAAWLQAQRRGRPVVLRCAASMASVVTGAQPQRIALGPANGPVLVVCASYTAGATAQLAALTGLDGVTSHELDLACALSGSHQAARHCAELAAAVTVALPAARACVLSTPRRPLPEHLHFAAGEQIMDMVVQVARLLAGQFSVLVSKGGITSARLARDALAVPVAHVQGQVLPGIPVWELGFPPGGAVRQVVVPGNVGEPDALAQIVSQLSGG